MGGLMTPAHKKVLAERAKVQRITQASENTSRQMREPGGATTLHAPTDSIFANVDQPR
jgi:hypothetical protein